MKFLLIAVLVTAISACAKSQDSTTMLSQFEIFITRPGSIIQTDMKPLGKYGPYKVVRCTAREMGTGAQTYAIRIDNSYPFDYPETLTDPQALYIDSADLDAFITAAESFLKTVEAPPLPLDTRFSYITAADIQIAGYFDKMSGSWSLYIDKVFRTLRTHVPGTSVMLSKKRMQQLVAILKQAG